MIDVTLLFNKSNPFGISKDVEGIRKALGGGAYSLRESDPLEPPVSTNVAIHLEIPVYSWMPWATRNILVVNPEWFESAWLPYMSRFDLVIYKDPQAREEAIAAGIVTAEKSVVVPWGLDEAAETGSGSATGKKIPTGNANTGFVWFLGGSRNKRAAVAPLVALWKDTYPPLRIYAVEPLTLKDASGNELALPSNVRIEVKDIEAPTRLALSRFFRGHVACSKAEGFGYTAAEAEWAGAFTILNDLPVYRAAYAGEPGVHILPSLEEGAAAAAALDSAITAFEATDFTALAKQRKLRAMERWDDFKAGFRAAVDVQAKDTQKVKHLPPIVTPAECPPISIVTLLYNRRKFFDLACHNIMITDYPKDKIEWIIVEDSDDPMEDASDRVMAVAATSEPVRIVYVPLKKKHTVGAKRNIGVERATADIVVMMDDDDHYPETSIRRRVAWLTAHPWGVQAVAATTIACYDLVHGVSAVNSPPFTLPLSQRVSEATLAFRRSLWEARKFPADVQVGEGEGFLAGREHEVLEIPPQQAIVAFSHGKNASSRRLPSGEGLKPGCFWGFPAPFLKFIHELAGVKVVAEEEEGGSSSSQKGKKK